MSLSSSTLRERDLSRLLILDDRDSRVKLYTLAGVQVGVAGVGEGDNRLTFPVCMMVEDVLGMTHWIRYATPEELSKTPTKWWRELEFRPRALAHGNGILAQPNELLGEYGSSLTALVQPSGGLEVETKPCADVSAINTHRLHHNDYTLPVPAPRV